MRNFTLFVLSVVCVVSVLGCEQPTAGVTPEKGDVAAYLEAHPELATAPPDTDEE